MKKNKLTKILLALMLITGTLSFLNAAEAAQENLLKYSQDCTDSVWTKYFNPTITLNGDGSQTIAQTSAFHVYAQQTLEGNGCMNDGTHYIFRAQADTTGISGEYVRFILRNGGAGSYGFYDVLSRPESLTDWVPIQIPFVGNVTGTGANSSAIQIGGPAGTSTINVQNMQIAVYPGHTLYSCGDSICQMATNNNWNDNWTTYTYYYGWEKNIGVLNAAVGGTEIAQIYSKMQTDLASTTYPVIFIEGGVNDINHATSYPVDNMITSMTDMITFAKTKADLVVVFNIPPNEGAGTDKQNWHLEYNSRLLTLCADQNVQHFDLLAVLGNGVGVDRNMEYYDAIPTYQGHPHAGGHEVIATALASQVTLPNSALYLSDYVVNEGSCTADTTPPVRSDSSPSGTLVSGTTQTTISLTTNEGAICKYDTTSGTVYDSMASTFATTSETSHSQLITGLSDGNTYNYYVRCKDRATNQNLDDYTISFNIDTPTCVSFTYSDWGACQENNSKTRTVISQAPSGCVGGDPITEGSCTYDDEEEISFDELADSISSPYASITGFLKEKLKAKKTLYVKKKKFSFKGEDIFLAGGTVKLYRGSKLKDEKTIDNDGKWKIKVKEKKNKTYTYKIKYYDENGNKLKSKKFKIKIDAEDPEFTDLPSNLVKSKGEAVYWKAKDNQKIKRFKAYFNGSIRKIQPSKHEKKEEASASFVIPMDTAPGTYSMKIRAYDKAGNKETRYVEVRVR